MVRARKSDPEKIKKILEKRGYPEGKPPKGKVVHHVKPLKEGGKDTPGNIRVIPKGKHERIHKHRRARGKI